MLYYYSLFTIKQIISVKQPLCFHFNCLTVIVDVECIRLFTIIVITAIIINTAIAIILAILHLLEDNLLSIIKEVAAIVIAVIIHIIIIGVIIGRIFPIA